MLALLLASLLTLTPSPSISKVGVYGPKDYAGQYEGIYSGQSTTTNTFVAVDLTLGAEGIKIRSKESLLVFRNSTLQASESWAQYTEGPGVTHYYDSYIAIDGKLIVKPNGHTITLHRVKSATDKTAAIIVKGEGNLVLDNPENVTVVRPEDLVGLAIQVKGKKKE